MRISRRPMRSSGIAITLAALLFLHAPGAQACPDGPTLPELVLVTPIALAALPVGLAASAVFGATCVTLGGGAFLATLPIRVRDPERANQLTEAAFRAPLTALEELVD